MTSGENTQGNYSKLQGNLNFAFDQRESEVNHHKVTSPESPCSVSPAYHQFLFFGWRRSFGPII